MTVSENAGAAQAGHNSGRCTFDESARRLRENSRWLAGGVSSNFRLGIAPTPLVFERGEGACLYDVDGNRLIDYYLGMGPMILGHNPEGVRRAAAAAADAQCRLASTGTRRLPLSLELTGRLLTRSLPSPVC
jgi:glutamate-1-semialdehyde aminotransferase